MGNRGGAAITATVLLLAGCTQATEGEALKGGDPAMATRSNSASAPSFPSYREPLDSAVQAQLKRNDEVRKVDPCSLINIDAAATLGPIKYIGTDKQASDCRIEYDVPLLPGQEGEMLPKHVPGLVSSISFGSRLIDSFGRGDSVMSLGGSCNVYRISGYVEAATGKPETVSYHVSMSGSDLGVDDPRDGCDDMVHVADASSAQRHNPTARADSRYLPHSKLMTVDPCAPLDSIGATQKVELLKPQEVFECEYKNAGDSTGQSKRSIRHEFWNYKDLPHPKRTGPDLRDVRGVKTRLSKSGAQCTYTAYVDLNDPLTGSDPKSQFPQWVGTLLVQGDDTNSDCSSLLAVTDEAVRRYQEQ
ncbi:hypothetical protein FZI91_02295 [Mycobacterium sp. CBMA271]|uniref:hypothetical protein n=1 Tax=unclassified Mycobacteroides TaxID=2618759 RepID=UPI0012DDB708|nr:MULTISPECIES: hypothetical protein [unclassified Mycobacteroides]MUM20536.1 hypothetical protein [Mycobacteroides sp. CBMA 271]